VRSYSPASRNLNRLSAAVATTVTVADASPFANTVSTSFASVEQIHESTSTARSSRSSLAERFGPSICSTRSVARLRTSIDLVVPAISRSAASTGSVLGVCVSLIVIVVLNLIARLDRVNYKE